MKQTYLIFVFISIILTANAQVPSTYYDGISGTGYTLKTNLHNLISGQTSLSYDNLHTYFETTDVDNYFENDGTVLDMYSENPDGVDPYNFTFTSGDQCGNYSEEGDCYNREHSFPKSWFDDGYPMYADLFHLYPTDGKVNGYRSNYPFGETTSPTYTSQNGTKKGPCSYPGYTGTVFEPIDEFKGDFARTYFYMATCYQNVISGWSGSAMLDGSSDQVYTDWALNMLIEWHLGDPVSQKEMDRNDAVYDIQGNANPFIDHPDWVTEIWGGGTINPEPDNQPTSFTATLNGAANIDLSWVDATGTNLPDGYLIKANTTGSFTNPTDGNDPTTDGNLADGSAVVKVGYGDESYSFTNLSGTTTYYFKIWSYANVGSSIDFNVDAAPTANATTLDAPVVIHSEYFSSCPGSWTSVSISGSADWECDVTYEYVSINAFGADVVSDDYLISPEINLDAYSGEVFSFDSWTKYSDIFYPAVELLYTTNYTGDPSTTTWQTLSTTFAPENSETWTASGDVDLSGISGAAVRLAFHYTSSGTGGGTTSLWDVDNIMLTGFESGPMLSVSTPSLSGFAYEEGSGPSSSQSFTLSGSDLDGTEVTVTAPVNYEISLNNSTFSTSETVAYTTPTLNSTTVYVRLKAGLTASEYNNENVTCADNGSASSVSVANSGEVTAALNPALVVTPTSLSGFTYEEGSGPSSSQSFTLSGSDLDGTEITISAPANYEISLDNSTFLASETVAYTAATLENTTIYVRLKAGLAAGTYNNENITCADNGSAGSVTVANSGEVTAALNPALVVTPTSLSGFTYEEGNGPSSSQNFTLSGSDLDGTEITISAPANYEISLDNSTFSASETVAYTAPTLNSTAVYVRLKAGLTAGEYNNENITCADNGSAGSVTVANNGEVTAALNPALVVTPTSLSGFTYEEGSGPSSSQSFTLSGTDLDGTEITITVSDNYEISLDNSTFSSSETIAYTAPTLDNTTVYVRMASGLAVGEYTNKNVVCTDNGTAGYQLVSLSGAVTVAPEPVPDNYPTDFAAAAFSDTQINVNWTDATGTNLPTGYLLKASTSDAFTTPENGTEPDEDSDLSDGEALLMLPYGTVSHSFTNLLQETTYYFSIWPYANSGEDILYKTDGNAPVAEATTMGEGVIDGTTGNNQLAIYPNPANEELNIELKGRYFIRLFSIQGELKYEEQFVNKTSINVHDFDGGIYLIHIQGTSGVWHEIIVVE